VLNPKNLGKSFADGFFLIAGPCVIESEDLVFEVAGKMQEVCRSLGIDYIFKASFDKANRSSHSSFRGCGLDKGLAVLENVRRKLKLPVLTDVHSAEMIPEVATTVDVLQIPAFLCRQTDIIKSAMQQKCVVNIKKGQFLAPWDMQHVVAKAKSFSDSPVWVCERGTSFGYNNLVVDMRGLELMRQFNAPVVFDATHSVQLPGGKGDSSSGQREYVATLSRAAVAVGVSGLFMETHPCPEKALSDGPNCVALQDMHSLLASLQKIDVLVKSESKN
jgi:2-dehydro-3-deoxyphosphooctonate aldolase (KDO 8-P synthase)